MKAIDYIINFLLVLAFSATATLAIWLPFYFLNIQIDVLSILLSCSLLSTVFVLRAWEKQWAIAALLYLILPPIISLINLVIFNKFGIHIQIAHEVSLFYIFVLTSCLSFPVIHQEIYSKRKAVSLNAKIVLQSLIVGAIVVAAIYYFGLYNLSWHII